MFSFNSIFFLGLFYTSTIFITAQEEFSNWFPCEILDYIPGPCPGYEEEFLISEEEVSIEEFDVEEERRRCSLPPYIDLGSYACSDLVRPVCAYKEDSEESGVEYQNPCLACVKNKNDYYVYGSCP